MAKSIITLSFSQIPATPADAAPCDVLFTQVGRPPRKNHLTPTHTHPFWQMEIMTRGRVHAEILHHHCDLDTGDCLLIPPETPHAFTYPSQAVRWVSLKFKAQRAPSGAPFFHPVLDSFGAMLRDTLVMLATAGHPERATQTAIQGALSAFLLHCYPQRPPLQRRQSQVAQAIGDYVRRHPEKCHSIKNLAVRLDYSPGHLSALFQQDSGQSLKSFLDQQRVQSAQRMLLYADMTIAQVALTLGFPDIFTFSRFFKRVSGTTPSQYRLRGS